MKEYEKKLIDKLHQEHHLSADEYKTLLGSNDEMLQDYLAGKARAVAKEQFGSNIYLRGLIEISNSCRNNCLYCGIRAYNRRLPRYTLTRSVILNCCRRAYELGFRTFVLQSGEERHSDWIVDTVKAIHTSYPDCAITLSLGEKRRSAYQNLFKAGATRYLLRHEAYNAALYQSLHTRYMSHGHRMQCLTWLKEIGYQTGTGFMVGVPGQTLDHLLEDIAFIERFQPQMIGIGPFLPHRETPFAGETHGSLELTLKLISIFRLIFPQALIPATTSLSSLMPNGPELGILAGANVLMPNLTPKEERAKYSLYDNKASLPVENKDDLERLEERLAMIGYAVSYTRGDYQPFPHESEKFPDDFATATL